MQKQVNSFYDIIGGLEEKKKESPSKCKEPTNISAEVIANTLDDDQNDDDWAPEPYEHENLNSAIGKLVMDSDLEKSEEEVLA